MMDGSFIEAQVGDPLSALCFEEALCEYRGLGQETCFAKLNCPRVKLFVNMDRVQLVVAFPTPEGEEVEL